MDYTHSVVETIEPGFYAFDMEYSSLEWDADLKWGQFFDPEKNHVFLVRVENFKNIPWSELEVTGHYMQGDLALLKRDGYDLPKVIGCTWIMARILQIREQSLEALVDNELEYRMISFEDSGALESGWDEPTDLQIQYMCDDTVWQYRLWKKWADKYATNYGQIFKMESRFSEMYASMKSVGIEVNDTWQKMSIDVHKELARMELKLTKMAGFPFRINARADKIKVLIDEMKLRPLKMAKTGPSIDKEMLEHYAGKGNAFVDLLLEAVELEAIRKACDGNKKGTTGFKKEIHTDNKIHTSFYPVGYEGTSRVYSSGPNTNSLPMALREHLIPGADHKFWYVDLTGCELITMARAAGCTEIVEVYDRGDDPHEFVASRVLGISLEEAKGKRDISKVITFSIAFGSEGAAAGRKLGISTEAASAYVTKFFTEFPEMKDYQEAQIQLLKDTGCAFTVLGRIRRLPEYNYPGVSKAGVERKAICTSVQSSAADLVKLICWSLYKNLPSGFDLVYSVFDSMLIRVPADAKWEDHKSIVDKAVIGLPKGNHFRYKNGESESSWAEAQQAA